MSSDTVRCLLGSKPVPVGNQWLGGLNISNNDQIYFSLIAQSSSWPAKWRINDFMRFFCLTTCSVWTWSRGKNFMTDCFSGPKMIFLIFIFLVIPAVFHYLSFLELWQGFRVELQPLQCIRMALSNVYSFNNRCLFVGHGSRGRKGFWAEPELFIPPCILVTRHPPAPWKAQRQNLDRKTE